MKIMNKIEAEKSGKISEILITNEEPVEYGQKLIVINTGDILHDKKNTNC